MRRALLLLALLTAAPAAAQTVVTSRAPQSVAVTVYRGSYRDNAQRDEKWPRGFALITETRTVQLPPGRFVLRFEGVSDGMMPETAIVTGLPKAIDEKNRDARLLSPASLVNAYLKRRVKIRRTSLATGKVTTGEAVVEAGPGNGVVLTTADGVEALGCSGLPEALSYPGMPADLSAKPTLSVIADSAQGGRATVQLSYLSQGFDWSAYYIATIAEDEKSIDLFAWMTMRNGGGQGFSDTQAQAVAGKLNRADEDDGAARPAPALPELHLRCWPTDVTSTHPKLEWQRMEWEPAPMDIERDPSEFVVLAPVVAVDTAMSAAPVIAVSTATLEELGDLKLYRLPERVDLAAMSQKQIALFSRPNVHFDRFYTAEFSGVLGTGGDVAGDTTIVFRTENRETNGLGIPLPSGPIAVYETRDGKPVLLGEWTMRDRAVGEEIGIGFAQSSNVRYRIVERMPVGQRRYHIATTNANAVAAMFELWLPSDTVGTDLIDHNGRKVWRVSVPANGSASFDFTLPKSR